MKLEEVLPALRAGKRVRYADHEPICDWGRLASRYGLDLVFLKSDNWSIVEEPATDEELAAAFDAEAERCKGLFGNHAYQKLVEAADMVRKRYVDPSWKVGK